MMLTFFQIPEDLQPIISDAGFFKENTEITTKEILKRYGDIGRGTGMSKTGTGSEPVMVTPPNRSNSSPASAAQIESDQPSHDAARKIPSSVRPVPNNHHDGRPVTVGPSTSGDLASYQSYREGNDSQLSTVQSHGSAHSFPYRPRPSAEPGPMGVTGY